MNTVPKKDEAYIIMRYLLFCLFIVFLMRSSVAMADGIVTEKSILLEQEEKLKAQEQQLKGQQEIIEDLRRRVLELEKKMGEKSLPQEEQKSVNLEEEEIKSGLDLGASHTLAKPWFQRIDISGFAAAAFIDTGKAGTRPNGGFLIKEASLFIEAEAWEDTAFFLGFQTNPLGDDATEFTRTGEVYAHFRNLLKREDDSLGIKVGRLYIPFGEEYLWQYAIDNPLISNSAAYPYGFDEGVLLYGKWHGLGWIASIMDGTDERSIEDGPEKAFNLKFYGSPVEPLYLSASFMTNGDSKKSGFEFGGSHLQPVGADHVSTLGASPSQKVDSTLYELDARYVFKDKGYVSIAFGQAFVLDDVSAFDRDILWFSVEPLYNITNKVYLVGRYSEIGTYDSDKGYHFDGKTTAGGNAAFGYDTKRLRRISLGLGWKPNPNTVLKLEYSWDDFDLIDVSTFDPGDNNRNLIGIETVLKF